jgi:hypothetical protein
VLTEMALSMILDQRGHSNSLLVSSFLPRT